jgi:hypothetical protein
MPVILISTLRHTLDLQDRFDLCRVFQFDEAPLLIEIVVIRRAFLQHTFNA